MRSYIVALVYEQTCVTLIYIYILSMRQGIFRDLQPEGDKSQTWCKSFHEHADVKTSSVKMTAESYTNQLAFVSHLIRDMLIKGWRAITFH